MKRFIYLLLIFILGLIFSNCNTRTILKQYSIVTKFDIGNLANDYKGEEILVTMLNDTTVFRYSSSGNHEEYEVKNGLATLKSTRLDTLYKYDCFLANKTRGLRYDSQKMKEPVKILKDSVMEELLYSIGKTYSAVSNIEPEKNETDSEYVERYKITRNSPLEPDSIYYFFSKKKLPLTFLKENPKHTNRSMNRVSIIYYETLRNGQRRKIDFKILPVDRQNNTDIKCILGRFKMDNNLVE